MAQRSMGAIRRPGRPGRLGTFLRTFLPLLLVILATIVLVREGVHLLPRDPARPNVLVIMTDDQRADTMSSMPEVSSMGGTTFENGYATTSVCCPARAAFLTGRYSHNTGVWSNTGAIEDLADEETETLAVWLDRAGYRTAWFGKYLNGWGRAPAPPGWDAFVPRPAFSWGPDYHVDAIAQLTFRFMRASNQPSFVVASVRVPHAATGGDAAPLEPTVPAPGTLCPTPAPWRPPSYGLTGALAEEMDAFRAAQLCALGSIDSTLRALIDAVPADTVVVFVSDNGYMWGEHGGVSKGVHWDESVRIPFQIRVPGTPTARTPAIAGLIDVAPTILDAVGLPIPESVDGISLMPVIRGEASAVRAGILIEHLTSRGLRTLDLLYLAEPAEALYADAWQLIDVVDDPAYADELASARRMFASMRDCTGHACR